MTTSSATSASATTSRPSHGRHGWVDVAKGICIVAVVCYYAQTYMRYAELSPGWLAPWTVFAKPFRMPDFFLLSGLFLSRVINRPWRSYLDTKVVHYVYFIVLWTVFYLLWRQWQSPSGDGGVLGFIKLYIYFLIQPMAMLWFIQVLAIYFVVTRLLRAVPGVVMLAVAAAMMLSRVHTGFAPLNGFMEYYLYFFIGYWAAPRIFGWADWVGENRSKSWLLLLAWIVANTWATHSGLSGLRGVDIVVSLVGILAVIGLSRLISESAGAGWVRYLGQNSIVVYLGFYLPLQMLVWLHQQLGLDMQPDVRALLLVALSVLAALVLNGLTRRTPLAFLFKRPAWVHLVAPGSRGRDQQKVEAA